MAVALAVEAAVSTAAVVAAPVLAAAVSMAARIIALPIIPRITIIPITDPIGAAGTLAVGIPAGTITAAVVASEPSWRR